VLAVVIGLIPLARGAAGTDAQKSVFVLWGGRPDLYANAEVDHTLRSRLDREFGTNIDIHMEYVDTFRDDEEERRLLRDFIRHKYAGKSFDVVIPISNSAVQFLRQYGQELFPDVPIVAWGGRREVEIWPPPPPITAVFVKTDVPASFQFIRDLQPDVQRVYLVAGGAPRDHVLLGTFRSALGASRAGMAVDYLVGLSVEELQVELAHLPPRSAVLWLSVTADGAGRRLINRDTLAHVCRTANAPVYGLAASLLDTGIVGGWLADQAALSEATADIAVRVLRGARVEDIPPRQLASVPMVDWRVLRRWGIGESRLPAGTVVRYREPTVWDAYKWRILGGVAVCLAEAVLIVALLLQRVRRRRAETTAAELRRELTHLSRVDTIGELSGALAHELTQPLTAILSNAQAAQRLLASEPPDIAQVREALVDIVDDDVRAGLVIRRLRGMLKRTETVAQPVDLNEAIRDVLQLARGDLHARGVSVYSDLQPGIPAVIGDRVQLQQVLLNLIFNACDAMAGLVPAQRRLTVATASDGADGVGVSVADRGTGIAAGDVEKIFQPFVTSKQDGLGLGLAICRTIVTDHGGRLWATNNEGAGATLHVALPRAAPARASRAH